MLSDGQVTNRQGIHDELERVRADLHDLVDHATPADLRRRTSGTRRTNGQLLWHMACGYLIVRRLLPLVRLVSRLPGPVGRAFAATLDACSGPFHLINYLGPVGAARVVHGRRLTRDLDRSIDQLHHRLDAESERTLARSMRFPGRWDPFFRETMTVAHLYHYGTEHYDFHRRQLTLGRADHVTGQP